MPPEWLISRVCEEFSCLPSAAYTELMEDPHQMAVVIMELRAYQRAYQQLEKARESERMPEPEGEMVERVHEINAELLREGRDVR